MSISVNVCTSVHISVVYIIRVHVCGCPPEGQRRASGVFLYSCLSCSFETGSFAEPGTHSFADWLAASKPRRPFFLWIRPVQGLQVHTAIPVFFHKCWRFEFRSSCLHCPLLPTEVSPRMMREILSQTKYSLATVIKS